MRDEKHFDELLGRSLDDEGPVLLAAKIDDKPGAGQTPRDPALIRSRFMKGLGTGRGGRWMPSVGFRNGLSGRCGSIFFSRRRNLIAISLTAFAAVGHDRGCDGGRPHKRRRFPCVRICEGHWFSR